MSDLKTPTLEVKKAGKKEKKEELRTIRIEVKLFEPTKDSFPKFNVRELLKQERKKYLKESTKDHVSTSMEESASGHAFSDHEDDDVARIAKQFEEKYENGTGYDLSDKGAGYDENDSFIDNTEAFDEKFEDDTPCGGFYINSGPLKFDNKKESNTASANGQNKRQSGGSYESADSDDGDDDKGKKQKKNKVKKQKRKEQVDQKPCKEIAIKDMLRFQRDNLLKNKTESPKHKRNRIISDDDDSDDNSIALSESSNDSDIKSIEGFIVSCPSDIPEDISKKIQEFNSISDGKTSDQILTNPQLYQILSEIEGSKALTLDQKIAIKTYLNSIVQCADLYRKVQKERIWEKPMPTLTPQIEIDPSQQKPPPALPMNSLPTFD